MDNITKIFQLQTIRELLEKDIDSSNITEIAVIMSRILTIESKLAKNEQLSPTEQHLLKTFLDKSNEHYFR